MSKKIKHPTYIKAAARRYGIAFAFLLCGLFMAAQEPTPYLEYLDSGCDSVFHLNNPGPYEGDFDSSKVVVQLDTFEGFWLLERFFVPSRGMYLQFTNCGITFETVPTFFVKSKTSSGISKFFTSKSYKVSNWARHSGFVIAGIAGYCGGQAEHLRFTNGLSIHNGDAFHLNRDLSLWGMGGTGIALTTAWFKDPHLKWWEIPVDIIASFTAYQLGRKIGYK